MLGYISFYLLILKNENIWILKLTLLTYDLCFVLQFL